jgi:hypothetical protein
MSGENRGRVPDVSGVLEVSKLRKMRKAILVDLKNRLNRTRPFFDNDYWFEYDVTAEQVICCERNHGHPRHPTHFAFVTMTMAVKSLDIRDRHFRIRNSIPLADSEYYKLVVDSINDILDHPHR